MKLVQGVGINDKLYPIEINGKKTKEYNLWENMLKRCYSKKFHANQTSYIGCSVSDNFKNYTFFYEWCHTQVGFGLEGSDLDKDILICNNKVYSEDTCVFVPYEINTFFTDCMASRGEYPIGVSFHITTGKYVARCRVKGKQKHLGLFISPDEAHIAYKQFKQNLCKELAIEWKFKIDNRVYTTMLHWNL